MPILTLTTLCAAAAMVTAPPAPRPVFPKLDVVAAPAFPSQLAVKFVDGIRARSNAMGQLTSAVDADVDAVRRVLDDHDATVRSMLSPTRAMHLEARALAHSARMQPDLAGFMTVEVPDHRRNALANVLNKRPEVEVVWFQMLAAPPPCSDDAPPTPDYVAFQNYRAPNPGLNFDIAWSLGNARGDGVTLADCEYGINFSHEDLCNVRLEGGQTVHPSVIQNGWDEHGTAVIGQSVSLDNGYGCAGLVPDAAVTLFPEWSVEEGLRRVSAIGAAIAAVDAGDIVLLEMQTVQFGDGFGPAELDFAVWSLVKNATDSGIIVVAAAGNGNENLDATEYIPYMNRGDSGGIIVGAGTPDVFHNKLPLSTYGSRVNLQAWGGLIFTLGYGAFAELDGDKNQRYTGVFGGTSGATALMAPVCVAIQGLLDERCRPRLDAWEMRELLIDTGHPQGTGGHIGPFPDVVAAAASLGIVAGEGCPCPGDFDDDAIVDFQDLLQLLTTWGPCGPPLCAADLDQSGAVDFNDLLGVLSAWGPCP